MRKISTILLLFLTLLNWQLTLLAQDGGRKTLKLDLEQAIKRALANSEDYQIQKNEVQRRRWQHKEELSQIMPQLSGKLDWSNNFEYPDIAATASMRDYSADGSLEVTQTFFTFGKVSNLVKAAGKTIDVSKYNEQALKQEIIYEVKLAYYRAYLAQETLQIAQESYQRARQNKKIFQQRAAQGRASRSDNIRLAADIASRKPVVNNARVDYRSALDALRVLIDADRKTIIKLNESNKDNYAKFEPDKMLDVLKNNQPVLKALMQTIKTKEYLIKAKRAEYYPEVSLFANWNHSGSGNDADIGGNLYNYGTAGVQLDIPIWTGGETKAQLKQAQIDKKNAQLRYKRELKDYQLQLEKVLNQYFGYIKTLKANKEAVRLARESFKLSQELFATGKVSVADLNDAELRLTNEKINKAITEFNLRIMLAKIKQLTLINKK